MRIAQRIRLGGILSQPCNSGYALLGNSIHYDNTQGGTTFDVS